jgi:hypothetical protein
LECKNNNFTELYLLKDTKNIRLICDKNVKVYITTAEALEREEQLERERKKKFSYFAQNYVVYELSKRLQKGEFEKTDDWQLRISETNREAKRDELLIGAEQAFIEERSKELTAGSVTLGAYDADKEVFMITNSVHGDWFVPVPVNEASDFKNDWNSLVKTPQYVIRDDRIVFAGYKFEPAPIQNEEASPDISDVAADVTDTNTKKNLSVKHGDISFGSAYSNDNNGIGVNLLYNVTDKIRLAGEFIYSTGQQDFNVYGHFLFPAGKRVVFYPSVGLGMAKVFNKWCVGFAIDGGMDIVLSPRWMLNCKFGFKVTTDSDEGFTLNLSPGLTYRF